VMLSVRTGLVFSIIYFSPSIGLAIAESDSINLPAPTPTAPINHYELEGSSGEPEREDRVIGY
jgi:hypothetical protein